MIKPNRFIIVSNENATKLQKDNSAERLKKTIYDPLMKYDRPIIDLMQPTDDVLFDTLEPNDLLISCGGDGTVNWLANSAIRISMEDKIGLLPQPFGGMNDISSTLYGKKSIDSILEKGTLTSAYTIEATHYYQDNTFKTINALGYIGIGASGLAANAVNTNSVSAHQKISDVSTAAKAIINNPKPFSYYDENNKEKQAYELLTMKTRMAGFVTPKHPLVFEEAFYFIRPKSRIAALGHLGLGIFSRAGYGSVQTENFLASITPNETIYMQADGEDTVVQPHETVIIKSGKPISVVRAGK